MPNFEPIDYRLRCHSKRTDLPADVLRDIGEAYAEIQRLQRKLADIKEGFEGCCNACEPVGALNQQLRKERDEARREVCDLKTFNFDNTISAYRYADLRKWDCFKEDDND